MAEFEVTGPHKINIIKGPGGRYIDEICVKNLKEFGIFDKIGCYVFVAGKVPIYVGKTKYATLWGEAFNPNNQLKITNYLNRKIYKRTLLIYLITAAKGKGDATSIDYIENFLILKAFEAKGGQLNTHGKHGAYISTNIVVKGIVGDGPGAPTIAAKKLKKVLKIY